MINSDEPKDGDFVAYVESLVRMPHGARVPDDALSPGEAPRKLREPQARASAGASSAQAGAAARKRAAGADAAWGRAGDAVITRAGDSLAAAEAAARAVVRGIAKVVAVFGTLIMLAGIALFAISFADDPPFPAEPALGGVMLVVGAVLNRIARKLA